MHQTFSLQDVANAVGAALGTVGGASDLIVYLGPIRMELESREKEEHKSKDLEDKVKEASYLKELDNKARRIALERGRECARNEVINKKGMYMTHCVRDMGTSDSNRVGGGLGGWEENWEGGKRHAILIQLV